MFESTKFGLNNYNNTIKQEVCQNKYNLIYFAKSM